ncbi:unnamed protein product [Ophioblennius macclurei]
MEERSRLCSVWLGSETGILKGVSVGRRQAFNFCNSKHLSRDQEVRVLAWGEAGESELLLGSVDGTVKTFSLDKGVFTDARRCGDAQEGCFVGLGALPGGALLTCAESGAVRVWREERAEPASELRAGAHVCRMRQSPVNAQRVATGGKENGLKLWDLERPADPLFAAKNLRDDWLDLRRPHWVRDVAFVPGSDKVVTCTGHHQVHVFDPSTPQRRPVLEAEFGEHPLTALALPAEGGAVVVGNTRGEMAVLDLRKGRVRGALKGPAGGVRALQCHASAPLVASCGLDRFLRVHRLDQRAPLHQVYLKSRLNCLLLSARPLEEAGSEGAGPQEVKEEEEEEDEVWGTMEQVEEEAGKRRPGGGGGAEEEEEQEEKEAQRKTKRRKKK